MSATMTAQEVTKNIHMNININNIPFRCPSRDSADYAVDFYEIFFGDTNSFSSRTLRAPITFALLGD